MRRRASRRDRATRGGPLAAPRHRLEDFLRKLEAATAALSNARPGATPEQILEAGLDLLQWTMASGGICGCTRHLQLDHIRPLALGGTSTADNLRILCRAHNLEAARLVFGDAWMDRYTRRAAGPTRETRPGTPNGSPGARGVDSG